MRDDRAIRRQNVTDMAIAAQKDRGKVLVLWEMVERFAHMICKKYYRTDDGTRLFELSDLYQSAYLAFEQALTNFDATKGAFTTYLHFHIRRACRREIGIAKNDPIFTAASLNKTPDDGNDKSPLDMLPDPYDAYADIDTAMMAELVLEEALTLENKRQSEIIYECTYQGKSYRVMAERYGISEKGVRELEERAIFYLRRRPALRAMYNEYRSAMKRGCEQYKPIRHTGLHAYKMNLTSSVEDAVMESEP